LISITGVDRSSNGVWRYSWSAVPGSDYYRVILFGQELAQTTQTYYDYAHPVIQDDPPPIEVVSESDKALSEVNRCFFCVQWYGVSCHHYSLHEYVGGEWVERQQIDETGNWLYTMTSPLLSDDTEYRFRIVAVSDEGQNSTPVEFKFKVVRPPTPVKRTVAWDSGSSSIVVT